MEIRLLLTLEIAYAGAENYLMRRDLGQKEIIIHSFLRDDA